MEIKVKLFGTFRDRCPKGTILGEAFSLNVKENANILDVLKQLDIKLEEARVIIVNSNIIREMEYKLNPLDLFVCFPPIGGG